MYQGIYPSDDLSLVNGFNLFRTHCMKCHSMNTVGGTMGPDFNVPRNITEYWKEEDIIAFAKNPKSIRANSNMPAMPSIPDPDYTEIIRYLKYMKQFRQER